MSSPDKPPRAAQTAHLLRIREVLERLRVSRSTFYLLVRNGKLRILKINGASRVLAEEVDVYIATLPTFVPPPSEAE